MLPPLAILALGAKKKTEKASGMTVMKKKQKVYFKLFPPRKWNEWNDHQPLRAFQGS